MSKSKMFGLFLVAVVLIGLSVLGAVKEWNEWVHFIEGWWD